MNIYLNKYDTLIYYKYILGKFPSKKACGTCLEKIISN